MGDRRYKQTKSTPEQRLFGRTVLLAFLTGLVCGPMIWFVGTETYDSIRSDFMNPLLRPPSFVWPLDALQGIVVGSFFILLPAVNNSYSQFLKGPQWKKDRNAFLEFIDRISRFMGFFLIGGGVDVLLDKPLTLTLTDLKASSLEILVSEIALTFLCALVIPISLSWYLLRKESTISRNPEERKRR